MKFEFSEQIFEIGYPQISNFMKIRPMGAEAFRANRDRLTDRHDSNSHFCPILMKFEFSEQIFVIGCPQI